MLNSESSIPLYLQLKQSIMDDINNSIYLPGERLPTEPELCEKYNVSRITVRKAVLDLVEEGYLLKQQGKGTFVKHSKVKRELVAVNGYSEYMISAGITPQPQIISHSIKEADKEMAEKLNIPLDSQVLELKRLLYFNNEPLSYENSTYSLELYPNLVKLVHENASMHKILKEHYEVIPAYNNKVLNVIFAEKETAEYLKCNVRDSLYEIEKIAFDANQMPIYHSILYYITSHVSFTITSEFQVKN
ncbi:GntR family transcriptional regulator [Niallia sp. NCCP-28]|uniref:GntR family transcriptional regulator n=1 Tax=Niallia sp. NCCP-28 TaxID=2934712 RepID=UPI002023628B|nr:GntR family transcriptional regulator [Niallia sp. NCCP-28]GKU83510.1 putative HTH-type transcriptional regulator YurK [Niallia sp. NCCP-28]